MQGAGQSVSGTRAASQRRGSFAADGECRALTDRRRLSARTWRLVEMGESRTPRPEPFAETHYERIRCFVVDRPDEHRHPAGRSSHVPLDRA